MKKTAILLIFIVSLFAQSLYFEAFMNIKKGKRILNSNPQKAQKLFIIAANDLKHIINNSISNNKPSANAMELMGELLLNGWGVEKNEKKAEKYLCFASELGNYKAKKLIQKNGFKCKKISIKEIQQ